MILRLKHNKTNKQKNLQTIKFKKSIKQKPHELDELNFNISNSTMLNICS